jgi:hypothetical protein
MYCSSMQFFTMVHGFKIMLWNIDLKGLYIFNFIYEWFFWLDELLQKQYDPHEEKFQGISFRNKAKRKLVF